jgi:hypothetical protein
MKFWSCAGSAVHPGRDHTDVLAPRPVVNPGIGAGAEAYTRIQCVFVRASINPKFQQTRARCHGTL